MDNKKINDIIKLENTIAEIYFNLYKLEVFNEKKGDIYSHYINCLNVALIEENKLFKSLSAIELMNISIYIEKNKDKINDSFSLSGFNVFIIERINDKIQDYMFKSPIVSSVLNLDAVKEAKKCNDILYIVYEEQCDIYLSFLDEYISDNIDEDIRKEFIFMKYSLVFTSGADFERKLVNNKFIIDSSLYIDTDIKAYFKKIELKDIQDAKKEICSSEIYNYLECFVLKNMTNKKNISYAENVEYLAKIRTYVLMIDNETFKSFISVFTMNSYICNMINNIFDIDIIEIMKKDRERHKYLSLKRK